MYDRTGSPALTSLLAAVEALPYLVLGLVGRKRPLRAAHPR